VQRMSKKERKKAADDVLEKFLHEPIENIAQAYFDDFVRENANNSAKVGLKTLVIREEVGQCCDWCHSLAGEYEYGEQPKDFFRRHDYCRCMVLFKSVKGKYTDIWSKKEFDSQKEARIAKARELEKEDELKKMTREVVKPYFDKATPSKGKIEFEKGWVKGQNGDAEIRYAKNIHQHFGGDIQLNSKRDDIKYADYTWNGKLWEHKSCRSENSVDKQVQKALKQIKTNPGGIVIERTNKNLTTEQIHNQIMDRISRSVPSEINQFDVIVFEEDNIIFAMNWRRKK